MTTKELLSWVDRAVDPNSNPESQYQGSLKDAIRAALAERDELKAWKEKYIKWAQEVLAYPHVRERMAERLILLRKLSVGENIE